MKIKWLLILALILGILVVAYLQQAEIITLKWQPLVMLLGAIAGPFRLLASIIGNAEEKTRKKFAAMREEETAQRESVNQQLQQVDDQIARRQQQLHQLQQEIAALNEDLQTSEAAAVQPSVAERQARFQGRFRASSQG